MSRPRSPVKLVEAVHAYSAPALCLLLWLGVCAIAWTSLSNLGAKQSARAPSRAAAADDQRQDEQGESLIKTASASTESSDEADPDRPTASETNESSTRVAQSEQPPDAVSSVERPRSDTGQPENDQTTSPSASSASDENDPSSVDQQQSADKTRDGSPAASDQTETNRQPAVASSKTSDSSSSAANQPQLTASKHIARAQLASEVENREPLDRVSGVFHSENKPLRRLYFFTEITGLRGHTVTHNWWHDGRLIAKVKSRVRGYSWRMSSSKKLIPSMAGPWRVTATDDQGQTLSVAEFVYKVP